MFTLKMNGEGREKRNEVQMGKGHSADSLSSRGKKRITLYKKPDTNLFCQMCLCSRNQRNSSASFCVFFFFFSKYWAPVPIRTLLSSDSLKAYPLFQWSSADLRILLCVSHCINPTQTAGFSAHTLVLQETSSLNKQKRKGGKNTSVIKFQLLSFQ